MGPRCRCPDLAALALLAACSATPPQAQPPTRASASFARTWHIADHVLAPSSALTDDDATEYVGRTVDLTPSSYRSPWHGHCEDAGRRRRAVTLADVAVDLELPASARRAIARHGLGPELTEFRFTCGGETRVPPLTLYVAGEHAMTCFAGACWLLTAGP